MSGETHVQPMPSGIGSGRDSLRLEDVVTKPKGSVINMRRTVTDSFVVTIDGCITHQCADMNAVIELLKSLQHPAVSTPRTAR